MLSYFTVKLLENEMLMNGFTFVPTQEYKTFEGPFTLSVESGTPEFISLPDGTRSTIVIVQDGPQLRNLQVSNQIGKDCS